MVPHSGPQTYMLLYFRSKADSCSWGHPTYTMRTLPYVGLPISGRCAPPHHYGSCVSESPSTARAQRSPLDGSLRVVRLPAPRIPHTQTWHQKPAQSRRTIGAQWCTSHTPALRKRRHRWSTLPSPNILIIYCKVINLIFELIKIQWPKIVFLVTTW